MSRMERSPRAPTALIGAYEPGPAPGGLRALMPLAGATLVEHQARRAVIAGAGRVLLLGDELPAELAAAVARLRHDGIAVGVARGLDAAADALRPDEPVLAIADACLPEVALLEHVAAAPIPAVATLPDGPDTRRSERIDADARWAGMMLVDGARVAAAAAMLGSWDPLSTLLRRAVQEGAARVSADAFPPVLAHDMAAVAAVERGIVARARSLPGDWSERWLVAPPVDRLLPRLLARGARTGPILWTAAVAALGAGALAWAGWRWPPLLLLLATHYAGLTADRLAAVRGRPVRLLAALRRARDAGAAIALIGLAARLARLSGQWGWELTGALALAAGAATMSRARAVPPPRPPWLATPYGLVWVLLPGAAAGRWDAGLALLTLHACASFAFVAGLFPRARREG